MLSPGGRDARESGIGDDKPYHGNTLRARNRSWRRRKKQVGSPFGPGVSARSSRQSPGHDRRFDDHRPRELRRALTALDERDWNLRASKAGARGFPGELHNEG